MATLGVGVEVGVGVTVAEPVLFVSTFTSPSPEVETFSSDVLLENVV